MNIESTGELWLYADNVYVNALTGTGKVYANYSDNDDVLFVGVAGGSGTFSGTMANGGSGSLNVTKQGGGTQTLAGNLIDYTGSTSVTGGRLILYNNDDTWTSGINVGPGATVEIYRDSGTTYEHQNAFTLSGGGTLEKTGNGLMDMNWSNGGTVAMSSGALIHVKQGTLRLGYGFVSNWSSNQSDLTVDGGATLDLWDSGLGNGGVMVDALNGSGTITKTTYGTDGRLTVGVDNGSGTFSGTLTNQSAQFLHLVKTGAGTQTLSGVNTYTGTTTVAAGTLLVDGSIVSPVTVAGGTLGGTGVVSAPVTVLLGGTLAPGVGIGTLGTGNLTLLAGSLFDVELTTTRCDMVDVTGSVDVTDAILDLTPTGEFSLFGGSEYMIVRNDGDPINDPITGEFFELGEGAILNFANAQFSLSYKGGDGNDIVLTAVPEPATMALLGLAACGLGGYIRRRRKA